MIDILIKVCDNSTRVNSTKKCQSQETIDDIVSGLFFNIKSLNVLVEIKNLTLPFKTSVRTEYFALSTRMYKTVEYYLQTLVVKTDLGLVFNEEPETISRLAIGNVEKDYGIGNNVILVLEVMYYLSNQVVTHNRSFIKVQSIFANLGGIIQVIILGTKLIFNPILLKKFNLKIINHLFDFDEIEKENLTAFNNKKMLKSISGVKKESQNRFLNLNKNENNFYTNSEKNIKSNIKFNIES
jgi:hypothetical protein